MNTTRIWQQQARTDFFMKNFTNAESLKFDGSENNSKDFSAMKT